MLAAQNKTIDLQVLIDRLAEARNCTDKLFEIVRSDSLYERPIPERHRIVFYVGHLEAFDLNLFRSQVPALKPFAPEFDKLFAFGIDPVGGGLPTDQPDDWPQLAPVNSYRNEVRHLLDAMLQAGDFQSSAHNSVELLLNVAIEHRLMHAETLAYMVHQLPFGRKHWQPQRSPSEGAFRAGVLQIPEGIATLGLEPRDAQRFGWDNEFEAFETEVPAFRIDKYMVTNGEFLEFLRSGAYDNRQFWSEENWRWKQERNIQHPAFWIQRHGDWHYRGMFEESPLPLNWPVYVSWAEANAYAKCAHKSLPTEAQWHRAAYGTPQGSERTYPWGNDVPRPGL